MLEKFMFLVTVSINDLKRIYILYLKKKTARVRVKERFFSTLILKFYCEKLRISVFFCNTKNMSFIVA